jgi:hypothetical protein
MSKLLPLSAPMTFGPLPFADVHDMIFSGAASAKKENAVNESKKKEKKEGKPKEYLVTRYEVKDPVTDKAKELAKRLSDPKNGAQAAMLYRFVRSAKEPPTFGEILAFARAALKGKSAETVEANWRWYVNDLKKRSILKSVEAKEERTA